MALASLGDFGDRQMSITGSFPPGTFSVDRFNGMESLGNCFVYNVTLLCASMDFDISSLVGDTVTVSVNLETGQTRYFNGYVTRMTLLDAFDEYTRFQIRMEPWFHIMSSRINSKIYQNMSVPDIAKKLFSKHTFTDVQDQLSGTYPAREFIVQYRESDFAFVSRLFERVGIYYYFRHEKDRHFMVLADSPDWHQTVDGFESVPFHPQGTPAAEADKTINRWEVSHQWRPGAYVSNDYDFERPKADLTAQLQVTAKHKKGDLEVFDYPAGYTQQTDVQSFVRSRLEALQYDVEVASAGGNVDALGAGNLFSLIDFPGKAQNKEYLIVSASFDAANSSHDTGPSATPGYFHSSFTVIDSSVTFSPPLATPMPRVDGPQTAIVVGEAKDEITTDNYGRVKVQFHWDRKGQHDEKSSCWIRVSQLWAGSGWGGIHIPRIGQEVIVDFLEGDPDRPIITGRVYNADNMPPYDLPDNKTQSGIKSRSTMGGTPNNFNEIRFEDKKGSELVNFQAEKDLTSTIKHDEQRDVGNDRKTNIDHDEQIDVGNNRTETVAEKEKITIGGDREENVGKSEQVTIGTTRKLTVGTDETISVSGQRNDTVAKDEVATVSGNQTVNVGKNQKVNVGSGLTLNVGKDQVDTISGNLTFNVNSGAVAHHVGKKFSVDAGDQISLTSGSASITLKSNGDITISGANITLKGSGKISIQASSDLALKGSKISEN